MWRARRGGRRRGGTRPRSGCNYKIREEDGSRWRMKRSLKKRRCGGWI